MPVMKAGGTIPQAPNCFGTGRKKRLLRTPINLSVREKLAPSAAGPFPCSGRAWNFFLVQREGRRYRLMQREGIAWIGFGIGDELGDRLGWKGRIDHHDIRGAANARDRRDVTDEIEIELVVERRVDRVERTGQEKRVAVGRGTHDRLGADIAAATRPVVDNELLAEPLR